MSRQDVLEKAPSAEVPGGGAMRRLNLGTAVVAGLVLAFAGHLVAQALLKNGSDDTVVTRSDAVLIITLVCWTLGFMAGIGGFVGPDALGSRP